MLGQELACAGRLGDHKTVGVKLNIHTHNQAGIPRLVLFVEFYSSDGQRHEELCAFPPPEVVTSESFECQFNRTFSPDLREHA